MREPDFDGETYERELDFVRLKTLLERVKAMMLAYRGEWLILTVIAHRVGGREASVSARIRDLRKEKFGGYTVERRRAPWADPKEGIWEYRIPHKEQPDLFE